MRTRLVIGLFLGTLSNVCGAAESRPDVDRQIQAMMASAGISGVQTVVVKQGKVVWEKSYGFAVLGQPGPRRPMRNDALLFTASVGKILTTVAVLQQAEKGKLSLDDGINHSVPFPVRNPAWPDVPITWRMLLTHTSSIADGDDAHADELSVYGHDPSMTLEEFVKATFLAGGSHRLVKPFTGSKPGTERIYSNDAFTLAGYALQQVVHEPFDRYVQHAILDPLSMHETSYRLAGLPQQRLAVGYAAILRPDGRYRYVQNRTFWAQGSDGGSVMDQQLSCPDLPSGCTRSSAHDFGRLLLMLLAGGKLDGAEILTQASVDLMAHPTGFKNLDGWTQGLGLAGPKDLRGKQVWGHDGQGRGAATAAYFNRETGVGAVTFANSMDPDYTLNYAVVDLDLHLMSWFEQQSVQEARENSRSTRTK